MSTIRILSHKSTGPEIGSAFLVHDRAEKSFLVTAGHVCDGASRMTLFLYSGTQGPDLGSPVEYEVVQPGKFWHPHADGNVDVAVAAFDEVDRFFTGEQRSFFAASIPVEWFQQRWEHLPPSPFDGFRRPRALDEVIIVGYPNDYRDTPTSLPVMRRGLMATPLWLDHEQRPVFLVDTAASHGTSGGPVFYVEEKQKSGRTHYLDSGELVLLGVFSEVLPAKAGTTPPGVPLRLPNLGAAYKAHTILEVITALGGVVEPLGSSDSSG